MQQDEIQQELSLSAIALFRTFSSSNDLAKCFVEEEPPVIYFHLLPKHAAGNKSLLHILTPTRFYVVRLTLRIEGR